jgi:SAM-dependent methyltransferase
MVRTRITSPCPYCGSRRISSVWPRAHYNRCLECGLFYRNPMPNLVDLDMLYAAPWAAPDEHRSETGGTDRRLARVYARRLARSVGRRDFRGLKILDFGAGRGEMLQALSELGGEVWAVEPFGYDYLKARGFTVLREIGEIPEEAKFDGLIAIDVVEHLQSPWEAVERLWWLLRYGGWICGYCKSERTEGEDYEGQLGRGKETGAPGFSVSEYIGEHIGESEIQKNYSAEVVHSLQRKSSACRS